MTTVNAGFLHMCGLGVDGPCQPAGVTPQVPGGIHLRWGFPFRRGFPRGGYFLFRRKSNSKGTAPVVGDATGGGPDGAPAGGGWQVVPGAPSFGPLLLPIVSNHPKLPAWWPGRDGKTGDRQGRDTAGGAGSTADAVARAKKAWEAAKGRIVYGSPAAAQNGFEQLHQLLCAVAEGSPAGAALGSLTVPAEFASAQAGLQVAVASPTPGDPDLLRLILLRAIEPAYAQLIGLYFVDTAVAPGQPWDYALLADRGAAFGGSAAAALNWLNQQGAAGPRAQMDIDVAWLLGMVRKPAGQLPAVPDPVRAYALPLATRPVDGAGADVVDAATMTAGLRWIAPKIPNVVGLPDPAGALSWTVERATLVKGPLETPKVPLAKNTFAAGTTKYEIAHVYPTLLVAPALVAKEPESDPNPIDGQYVQPAGWPPFRLAFVDEPLQEGWYAWRVTATDLFGRRSLPSAPAQWRMWSSVPGGAADSGEPAPWYAQPEWLPALAAKVDYIHPSAVGLFDKAAPPPPQGLWAQVMDPADPLAVKDAAWNAAYSAKGVDPHQLFLRVRWHWTLAQHRQAPDAASFRVYIRPGLVNTRFGQVTAVLAGSRPLQVDTNLDVPAAAAGSFDGAILRVNGRGFTVASSQALTSATSTGGVHFVCKLPEGQHEAAAAEARVRPGLSCTLVLQGKQHPGWQTPDDVRDGSWQRIRQVDVAWKVSDSKTAVFRPIRLGRADLGPEDPPQAAWLIGGHATLTSDGIQIDGDQPLDGIDVGLHVILLRKADAGDGGYPRLDDLDTARTVPFAAVYRNNRYFQVTKDQLAAANVPADWFGKVGQPEPEIRWAIGDLSKAFDVWIPLGGQLLPEPSAAQAKTWMQVVVTTADDKQHTADWLTKDSKEDPFGQGGFPGNEGSPAGLQTVFRVRRVPPDPPAAKWPSPCLATEPDGDGRSFFTIRWKKAGLSVRVLRASADSVFQADYAGRTQEKKGTDAIGAWLGKNWSVSDSKPEFRNVRELYETLTDKAHQDLADTIEVARAFSAVHSAPLGDAACPDALGPNDDPAKFVADAGRCAYVDTLPGRVPGVYFYRLQTIDAAGNVSNLGPASPPVQVPEVFVPSAPVIIEAYAGTPTMREELAALRVAWADFESGKSKVKPKEEWEVLEKYSGMVTLAFGVSPDALGKIAAWRIWRLELAPHDISALSTPPPVPPPGSTDGGGAQETCTILSAPSVPVTSGTVSYSDTTAIPGQEYCYTVSASSVGSHIGPRSSQARVKAPKFPKRPNPVLIQSGCAKKNASDSVVLAWLPLDASTTCWVQASDSPNTGEWATVAGPVSGSQGSIEIPATSSAIPLYFRLRAVDAFSRRSGVSDSWRLD